MIHELDAESSSPRRIPTPYNGPPSLAPRGSEQRCLDVEAVLSVLSNLVFQQQRRGARVRPFCDAVSREDTLHPARRCAEGRLDDELHSDGLLPQEAPHVVSLQDG